MTTRSDILEVAQRLGARLRRVGVEHVGPCPKCGGRDRFSINAVRGLFNCRGCGIGGDTVDLIRHVLGLDFREALEFVGGDATFCEPLRRPDERQRGSDCITSDDNREKALALWRRRRPLEGSLAEVYLRQMRGYSGAIPATLGFLPATGNHPPAMIAAYALASEPEPGALSVNDVDLRAVHLTKLSPTGEKVAKITLGRGAAGVPIVVAPPNDLLGLAVCEGIEYALSVHLATGLGVWAAGSAPFMPALADAVPSYIEHVTIIADDDHAGQRGSQGLALLLAARRIATAVKTLRRAHEAA